MSKNIYNFIHPKSAKSVAFSFEKAKVIPTMPIAHWILWATCLFLIGCYFYSIAGSVHNAVKVEKMEGQFSMLKKDLTDIEYSYMSLANKLDLREAYARGFVDSVNPIFVTIDTAPTFSLLR